jgi:hypothetical protein
MILTSLFAIQWLANTGLARYSRIVERAIVRECMNSFGIRIRRTTFSTLFLTLLTVAPSRAEVPCTPLNTDIPVRSTLASAGFFANLANAKNSINYQMDQLLKQAWQEASTVESAKPGCAQSCGEPVVALIFNSAPNATLQGYEDSSTCTTLYEATRTQPIVYADRTFDSEADAKDWYEDLTQGDGDDGEDLYKRCPGNCSPSYSSVSVKKADRLVVTTSIICGHARDKDDDQYRLSAALRWICP